LHFVTPVVQKRHVDLSAINGSASTIDMQSNPPSSVAAPAQYRLEAAESPLANSRLARASLKDNERIQTTHTPIDHVDKDLNFHINTQSHQFHGIPRMNLLNSTSPPSMGKSMSTEILGPTPQRSVIAAPLANSPVQFAS